MQAAAGSWNGCGAHAPWPLLPRPDRGHITYPRPQGDIRPAADAGILGSGRLCIVMHTGSVHRHAETTVASPRQHGETTIWTRTEPLICTPRCRHRSLLAATPIGLICCSQAGCPRPLGAIVHGWPGRSLHVGDEAAAGALAVIRHGGRYRCHADAGGTDDRAIPADRHHVRVVAGVAHGHPGGQRGGLPEGDIAVDALVAERDGQLRVDSGTDGEEYPLRDAIGRVAGDHRLHGDHRGNRRQRAADLDEGLLCSVCAGCAWLQSVPAVVDLVAVGCLVEEGKAGNLDSEGDPPGLAWT